MVLLTVSQFIGHFHPLLVHLPIGILLIAILFQWIARAEMLKLLPVLYGLGLLFALLSCISGYLLFFSGNYEADTASWHLWMALLLTATSMFLFWRSIKGASLRSDKWVAALLAVLIIITGHLGGTLTHGEGFLSFAQIAASDTAYVRKPVANADSAFVYAELVQPVMLEKCGSCHGAGRQKGGLRIDEKDLLLKGGKEGPAIVPASLDKSGMWTRVNLDISHDDHMPPKDEPQLNEQEKALLKWWIQAGCPFEQQLYALPVNSEQRALFRYFENEREPVLTDELPTEQPPGADKKIVQYLQSEGFSILPVALGSNFLSVSAAGKKIISDSALQLIQRLKPQLVYLKLPFTSIQDRDIPTIAACSELIRLDISHTAISPNAIAELGKLEKLKVLNLVGTRVNFEGVRALKEMPALREVYLYQTAIDRSRWKELEALFPKSKLDSGNYQLPTFITDTTRL